MRDVRPTAAREATNNICYQFLVDVNGYETTPDLSPDAMPLVPHSDVIRQQALSDINQKSLALNPTYYEWLGRPRMASVWRRQCLNDNSPLVLDTAPAQTLMQNEVMVVQSDNIRDDSFTTLMQCRAIWKL